MKLYLKVVVYILLISRSAFAETLNDNEIEVMNEKVGIKQLLMDVEKYCFNGSYEKTFKDSFSCRDEHVSQILEWYYGKIVVDTLNYSNTENYRDKSCISENGTCSIRVASPSSFVFEDEKISILQYGYGLFPKNIGDMVEEILLNKERTEIIIKIKSNNNLSDIHISANIEHSEVSIKNETKSALTRAMSALKNAQLPYMCVGLAKEGEIRYPGQEDKFC